MKHPQPLSWLGTINHFIALSLALLIFLLFPTKAYACACCANAGAWYENLQTLNQPDLQEINQLKFPQSAKIYLTAAGFDTIKGLASTSDTYSLVTSKNRTQWNFKFTDKQGKTGNLSLTMPTKAVFFGTDLYDRPTPDSRLYREVRLEGGVTGNGIFSKGITRDTKYRLVLQGRGNNCLNANDFKSWNLQIYGKQASYSFYNSFTSVKAQ